MKFSKIKSLSTIFKDEKFGWRKSRRDFDGITI